jgi:sialate O-acetylesterase
LKVSALIHDEIFVPPQAASPTSSPLFSALGYFFALKLQKQLNIPVGIVQVAYGGTPIEAWMSKESLAPFASEVKIPEEKNEAIENKGTPTSLFNGMINPMIGFTVKGMLWSKRRSHWLRPS